MNKIGAKPFSPVFRAVPPTPAVYRARYSEGSVDAVWGQIPKLEIQHFHPRSSAHRPRTVAGMVWNQQGLSVQFRVEDRFVRATRTRFQQRVSKDSCVEFFLQPREEGYFNFEINCIGTMLVYFIEDPSRGPARQLFRKYTPVLARQARGIRIETSLQTPVAEEIKNPVQWDVSCFVPWGFFEPFVGEVLPQAGARWRANFFKCGDETSHPHWASWCPIGDVLRFHQPEKFGMLEFASTAE